MFKPILPALTASFWVKTVARRYASLAYLTFVPLANQVMPRPTLPKGEVLSAFRASPLSKLNTITLIWR